MADTMKPSTHTLCFGVIGIDHRHIYHLIQGLLDAGAVCAGYVAESTDPKVLEGVPDHRDMVLTDAERAANKAMMVCVSGCKSERLVLDL